MHDARDQLYTTKLQLLAVVCTFVGIGLLLFGHLADDGTGVAHWLAKLPLIDLGSALFTTGLLAVAFEYIDRKDGDERANERLRRVIREEAPAIRQAVFDSLAFSPDGLKEVASPELLDRISQNALGLRLGDATLAAAVYDDVSRQVITAPERWYDLDVSIALTSWEGGPASGSGAMFVATIRTTYRTVPAHPNLRFVCASDMAEYRQLVAEHGVFAWYFQPIAGLDGASPEAYELQQFTVDGQERPIRRSKRKGSQTFTVSLGDTSDPLGREVVISYSYRVLVQRAGHLLFLDVPQPTKGIRMTLWYGETEIRYVSVLDFIASGRSARVLRPVKGERGSSVEIAFDGWVFAKSGLGFVWVLDREFSDRVSMVNFPISD